MNSPAFLVNKTTDFSELSMSPLQLLDSPVQAVLMTPTTSSGESSSSKSHRYLKQTSTPSQEMIQDTPGNKNKAFFITTNASVGIKAKRRLIEEECHHTLHLPTKNENMVKETTVQVSAAKRQKTSPKVSVPTMLKLSRSKKRIAGQINSGVSHRIRWTEKKVKPSMSLSLSELKKTKAEGVIKNPFDPLNRTVPTSLEMCVSISDHDTLNTESIQGINVSVPIRPLLPVQTLKSPGPKALGKENKNHTISPKIITRNWNVRYRKDTRERKFFKSRGTEQEASNRVVTVSVNENLKLQVHEKPVAFIRRSPRKSPCKQVVREAPTTSEDQNILNQDWDDDIAESMDISCNIQEILNGLSEDESTVKDAPIQEVKGKEHVATSKLFPLFCNNSSKPSEPITENRAVRKMNVKAQWVRALKDGGNQRILDAGQKKFGAVQCPECMVVYHVKDPEDELIHVGLHQVVNDTLKFAGWKKERVLRRFNAEGYIIAVHHGDAVHCWKKIENVLTKVVDNELGFSEIGIRNPETTKVYLYIADKKIVGVLVAHGVTQGCRMIPSTGASSGKCCSADPSPALCGISRIWVLPTFRRRKTASRLLDAMRTEFVYGKIISTDELAFSDPTENGLAFAQSYTKREDFLVYNM